MISQTEIQKDIDFILWSAQLKEIYRYQKQKFWEDETAQHEQAMQAYPFLTENEKLPTSESDAEHSWHIADIALIIGPRFPQLDLGKCVMLAVIHDKLEIITGDEDPLGKNGDGKDTHAFNAHKKALKKEREKQALAHYLTQVNAEAKPLQEKLFTEEMALSSPESQFVKALDRLQPLTYILKRKAGQMQDDHIAFSIRHTGQCKEYFPPLAPYHDALIERLLQSIADYRKIELETLRQQFYPLPHDQKIPA